MEHITLQEMQSLVAANADFEMDGTLVNRGGLPLYALVESEWMQYNTIYGEYCIPMTTPQIHRELVVEQVRTRPVGAVTCSRCEGYGMIERFGRVEGGICFQCRGSGYTLPAPSARRTL